MEKHPPVVLVSVVLSAAPFLALSFAVVGCVAPESGGDHSASTRVWEGAQLIEGFGADGVGPTLTYPHTFDRLAVQWDVAAGSQPHLEVRTSPDARVWGEWAAVKISWAEETARNGHFDVDGGRHTAAQLRIRGDGPRAVRFLVVEPISEVGPGPAGDPQSSAGAVGPVGIETQTFNLAPGALVRPRNAWNARAAACQSNMGQQRIYIHHTVTPYNDNVAPEVRMRGLQNYHMDNRGWCDIGYHYVVSRGGRIWQGRPETLLGAHVANRNSGSVGISFMGNFMEDRPNDTMLRNTGALVRWLRDTYNVQRNLLGHRDGGQTACPGDHLYARLDDIERLADGGGGAVDPPDPPPGANGVYRGVVYIAPNSDRRLPGARAWVQGRENQAIPVDGNGHFSFDLAAGEHTVFAEADGYRRASTTRTVVAGQDIWGSIGLARAPAPDPEPDPEPEPEPEPEPDPEPDPEPEAQPQDLAPTIVIEAPAQGTLVHGPKVRVIGRVFDDHDARIPEIEIAGVGIDTDPQGRFTQDIVLHEGENLLRAFAVDSAGNVGRAEVTVTRVVEGPADPGPDPGDPVIAFLHPTDGQVLTEPILAVEVRVFDPRIDIVSLNGVALPVNDGFVRTSVELAVGRNRLTLEARTPEGDLAREVIHITHDPDALPGPRDNEDPTGDDGEIGPVAGDDDLGGDPGPGPSGAGGDVKDDLAGPGKAAGSVGCAQGAAWFDITALLRR